MATTYPVIYDGGPCNGTTSHVSKAVIDRGTITCGGVTYTLHKFGAADYWTALAPQSAPSTAAAQTHVTSAWTRWMRILAHDGPRSHRRTLAATQRANRIARHR